MERLVRFPRGASPEARISFARDLISALEREGVEPGAPFFISNRPETLMKVSSPPAPPLNSELKSVTVSGLEGPGQSRRDDPATSKAAAKLPARKSQRAAVIMALTSAPGTATELEGRTGVPFRSLTPRLGELKRDGVIYETGDTRDGSMGAKQVVVALTDLGWKWAGQLERAA